MWLVRYQPVGILAIILYNYYITHLAGRHPERNKDKVTIIIVITVLFIDFRVFSCSKICVQEQYYSDQIRYFKNQKSSHQKHIQMICPKIEDSVGAQDRTRTGKPRGGRF